MRSHRWTGLILVAPLGFLLWGFFQMYHRNSVYGTVADQLPEEKAAAKREGIPLTPEEFLRTPPVPEAQNAAPLYREIIDAMQRIPLTYWDSVRPVILDLAKEKERQQARLLLKQHDAVLKRAEQAALLPECDFQPDWRQGVNLPYPDYNYMRGLVRLFSMQASLQCNANQPLEALHSLLTAARIARHIGQDPRIFSLATRMAMEPVLERPLIRTVQRYGNRARVLELANQIESVLDAPLDIERALRGECLLRLQTLSLLRKKSPRALQPGYRAYYPPHARREVVQDAWEVRCLAYWRRIFSRLSNAEPDPMEVLRAMKAISDEERADSIAERRRYTPTYEMSYHLEPDYTEAAQRRVSSETRHRLRRTQLALLAYRLRTGHFPEQLEALSSSPPMDPFAHQPLHYRKTATGFLLYSVGSNLADDNGDGKIRGRGLEPPDIVIVFPSPPERL